MSVYVFTSGFDLSDAAKRRLEARAWLAVQRAGARVSWVGVRLRRAGMAVSEAPALLFCRIDVWLRGIGLVTAANAGLDTDAAVDGAAVRVERVVSRKLRAALAGSAVGAASESSARATPLRAGQASGPDDLRLAEHRWEDDGGRAAEVGDNPRPAAPSHQGVPRRAGARPHPFWRGASGRVTGRLRVGGGGFRRRAARMAPRCTSA